MLQVLPVTGSHAIGIVGWVADHSQDLAGFRVCDDDRAGMGGEDGGVIWATRLGLCIKIFVDDILDAYIDGQVDVIADRWQVQRLVDGIIHPGNTITPTEVIIELALNAR